MPDIKRSDLLPGERIFPIYRMTIYYVVEHQRSKYETDATQVTFYRMEKKPSAAKDLVDTVCKAWYQYAAYNGLPDQGVMMTGYEIALERWDTWCIGWFNHYTMNVQLSDADLRRSFERFVRRWLPAHRRLQRHYDPDSEEEYYCLMGAEDERRWRICRCEYCQALGLVRIDH